MSESMLAKPARPWALRLLPPFPAVATKILGLVERDTVSTAEIGAVVKLDPTFSAEILRIANSALFGLRREVTSVAAAVALLGLDRIKALATLVALNSMVSQALRVDALKKIWVHSVITGILSEQFSRVAHSANPEGAQTAGLLHNLGTLGLMAAYPDEYVRMLEVTEDYNFDLLQTERALFEIDHCAAGAYLAQEWDFPDETAAVIATHHDDPEPGDLSLYGIVRVSWRLADALGYAAFSADRRWEYDELVARIPGAKGCWLGAGIEAAQAELNRKLEGYLRS